MKKNSKVTIVMYHYVRDLKNSKYPDIKGLDFELFIEQLEYLVKYYNLISIDTLINAMYNNGELPSKAALLTFDDGYIDHYTNVFPLLKKKKIQGAFYAPVKAIMEHSVLDVNKIHFLLASVADKNILMKSILSELDNYRERYNLNDNNYYFNKLAVANRFDTKEVIFIKRLLQHELSEELRMIIIDSLFKKYVSNDEESFAQELYLNLEQIKIMKDEGMHIGSHGNNHYWLGNLPKHIQEEEINKSLSLFREIKSDPDNWTMCYPYGSYNQDTIDILTSKGCKLALTANPTIADIRIHNRYEFPRLDTNDLPKDKNAPANEYFNEG